MSLITDLQGLISYSIALFIPTPSITYIQSPEVVVGWIVAMLREPDETDTTAKDAEYGLCPSWRVCTPQTRLQQETLQFDNLHAPYNQEHLVSRSLIGS